jgi:hypothetical protein
VFHAEVYAVLVCVTENIDWHFKNRNICLCH